MKHILFILSLVLLSCGSNSPAPQREAATVQEILPPPDTTRLKSYVAESTGIPYDSIKVQDSFIVSGDMLFLMRDIQTRVDSSGSREGQGAAAGITQMISAYKVNARTYPVVKVWVDTSLSPGWLDALDTAIANINGAGMAIRFERISSKVGANITISTNYTANSTIATAVYPDYYGKPGTRITINRYWNSIWDSKKVFCMVHELLHTLGISHTDGTFGVVVSGTPTRDAGSVMNSTAGMWQGFSEYDLQAIRKIYPKN